MINTLRWCVGKGCGKSVITIRVGKGKCKYYCTRCKTYFSRKRMRELNNV